MSDMISEHLEIERAEELARRLAAAVSSRRIYAPDHGRVQTALQDLLGDLRQVFGEGYDSVRFAVTGGILTHEGVPLGDRNAAAHLVQALEGHECGGVVLRSALADETAAQLVDWLAGRRPSGLRPKGDGLELLDPGAGDEVGRKTGGKRVLERLPELKVPLEVQANAIQIMEHVLAESRRGRHFDFDEVTRVVRFAAEAARSGGVQLMAATQLPRENPASFDHSVNVFLIAAAMMEPFARDPKELELFGQAALLHDVGKSLVPQEVLEKKGPLSAEEERQLRRHCEFGAKLLAKMTHVDPLAVEVAYCHHMRDDGHGYPTPILPIKPGPVSNMVQVGDLFDLVAESRPVHRSLATDEAVDRILRVPGMRSKKNLLRHFIRRATNSPPGSEVVLEGGERAIVVEVFGNAPKHPRVRVVRDREGCEIAEPYVLDLREAGPDSTPVREVYLKPNIPVG